MLAAIFLNTDLGTPPVPPLHQYFGGDKRHINYEADEAFADQVRAKWDAIEAVQATDRIRATPAIPVATQPIVYPRPAPLEAKARPVISAPEHRAMSDAQKLALILAIDELDD